MPGYVKVGADRRVYARDGDVFALRWAIRVLVPLLILGMVALGQVYYDDGPSLRFFLLLVGVPALIFLCATAIVRARTGRTPRLRDVATRAKGPVDDLLASVHRARRRRRVRRVEMAALRAAEGNELLSPRAVRRAAEALLRLVHLACRARDRRRLATLLGPDLLAEWENPLLEKGKLPGGEPVGEVRVEYVGLDAGGPEEPRVVVLIEAALREPAGLRRVCQYWTLGVRAGLFFVLAIEDHTEGRHHLSEPIEGAAPVTA